MRDRIREFLKKNGCDFLLIPHTDEHLEYEKDNRLLFTTGFSGSNGFALVSADGGVLFTDGRYLLQAKNELFSGFCVKDLSYFKDEVNLCRIAFCPALHRHNSLDFCSNKIEIPLSELDNLIGFKTSVVDRTLYSFELSFKTVEQKIDELLVESGGFDVFLFLSDNVKHFLNLRGNQKCCAIIYCDKTFKILKISEIDGLPPRDNLFLRGEVSYDVFNSLASKYKNIKFDSSGRIARLQAIKSGFEIDCIRRAFEVDAVALKEFLTYIKKSNGESELSACDVLLKMRQRNKAFISPSFETICGMGENGAVVHYHANELCVKKIAPDGLLLVDSGGQYYDVENKICGTTDITRTVVIGKATQVQRELYTLVLKGHIALASAVFKKGTSGADLDILARQYLWKNGLDYSHGTGHGVGYFLSVHEDGAGISKRFNAPLEPGMIVSCEPGVYLAEDFGIRIENVMVVKNLEHIENDDFLCFDVLSRGIPYDVELIDFSMLSDDEISWISKY